MPIIKFTTNAVEREIDGKKSRTSLSIEIERSQIVTIKDLKALVLAEAKKQGVYIKINSFSVGTHLLTDLSEIDRAGAGTDFTVNVTQLTEHELNVLKTIKVLKEEIEENKNLLTTMSTTRELLQEQLKVLDIEINSLTNTSQVLRAKMLEKAAELQRLVPTATKLPTSVNASVDLQKPAELQAIPAVTKLPAPANASIGKQSFFESPHQVLSKTIVEVTKDAQLYTKNTKMDNNQIVSPSAA